MKNVVGKKKKVAGEKEKREEIEFLTG